jgi:hypothetical protein
VAVRSGLPDPLECRTRALALLRRAATAGDPQEKRELEAAAREYEKLANEVEAFPGEP